MTKVPHTSDKSTPLVGYFHQITIFYKNKFNSFKVKVKILKLEYKFIKVILIRLATKFLFKKILLIYKKWIYDESAECTPLSPTRYCENYGSNVSHRLITEDHQNMSCGESVASNSSSDKIFDTYKQSCFYTYRTARSQSTESSSPESEISSDATGSGAAILKNSRSDCAISRNNSFILWYYFAAMQIDDEGCKKERVDSAEKGNVKKCRIEVGKYGPHSTVLLNQIRPLNQLEDEKKQDLHHDVRRRTEPGYL